MATYRPGRLTACLVDKMDASTYLNSSDWSSKLGTGEVTHYGSTAKEFIAGLAESSLNLGGMFDGASSVINATWDSLNDSFLALTTNYPITLCFDGGIAVGRRCAITSAISTNYTPSSPVGNVVSMKMTAVTNGRPGDAFVLTDGLSNATTSTLNYTAVDNGATLGATANGGVSSIHIPVNTRTGTITVKIQHSVDNVTFADLISQVVPATTPIAYLLSCVGTVNRYVRAEVITAAGSGAITVIAAFART